MRKTLPILFFFLLYFITSAQNTVVIGTVKSELGNILPGTLVINERTDVRTVTDKHGNFILEVSEFDKIRFVTHGYDVLTFQLKSKNSKAPLQIELIKSAKEIEEVSIKFIPTGILKKDLAYFKTNPKTEKLNSDARMWLKAGNNEIVPQNTIPSSFRPPDLSVGQIPLLGFSSDGKSTGLLGAALGLFLPKKSAENLSIADDLAFLKKVKNEININYFYSHGLDEYDFESFLNYANRTRELAKKFSKNFNVQTIEFELKLALVEYLKTHKTQS